MNRSKRAYVAMVLAKMQRGENESCARDFIFGCTERITKDHLAWAEEVLSELDRIDELSEEILSELAELGVIRRPTSTGGVNE